jgi:hypothetical protein
MCHGSRPDSLDDSWRAGGVVHTCLSGWCRPQTGRLPWLRNLSNWQEKRINVLRADLPNAYGSKRSPGLRKYRSTICFMPERGMRRACPRPRRCLPWPRCWKTGSVPLRGFRRSRALKLAKPDQWAGLTGSTGFPSFINSRMICFYFWKVCG